jgi:hypothetical protein
MAVSQATQRKSTGEIVRCVATPRDGGGDARVPSRLARGEAAPCQRSLPMPPWSIPWSSTGPSSGR